MCVCVSSLLYCGIWGNVEHLSALHVVLLSLYEAAIGEKAWT